MAPLWHEAFGEWTGVQRELQKWFDAARTTVDSVVGHFTWPPLNAYESDEEFLVTAEAPGMEISDFELTFANQSLVIRANRRPFAQPEGAEVLRRERAEGKHDRAVVLPATVDGSGISARYERGVLIVRVPKVPAARPRKIDVQEGQ